MNVKDFLKAAHNAVSIMEIKPGTYEVGLRRSTPTRVTTQIEELENAHKSHTYAYGTWFGDQVLYVDVYVEMERQSYLVTGSCNLETKKLLIDAYLFNEEEREFEREDLQFIHDDLDETAAHIQTYFESISVFRLPLVTGFINVEIV